MGKICVAIVKGEADWITFSRGHFLKEALMDPEFGGIYYFDPDAPTDFMIDKSEGWTLYMCGHGNAVSICGCAPDVLGDAIAPCLPSTTGMIFVLSCSTGKGSAEAFYNRLAGKGKKVIVRAPMNNNTFTLSMGFRVLDPPLYTRSHATIYENLKANHAPSNCKAGDLAKVVKGGQEISALCAEMAKKSATFWTEFSDKLGGCFSPVGANWVVFPKS